MAEIKYTLTEKEVLYLLSNLGNIQGKALALYSELEMEKAVGKLPNYQKVAKSLDDLGKYLREFDERCTDIYGMVKDKDWIDKLYNFVKSDLGEEVAVDIEEFGNDPFRKYNIRDTVTERLKECKDLKKYVNKSLYILADLRKKDPAVVRGEFEEAGRPVKPSVARSVARKKRPEAEAEAVTTAGKAVAMVAVLAFSFAILSGLNNLGAAAAGGGIRSISTGFFLLPDGFGGGVFISSLQMVMVMLASIVIIVYLFGKSFGEW